MGVQDKVLEKESHIPRVLCETGGGPQCVNEQWKMAHVVGANFGEVEKDFKELVQSLEVRNKHNVEMGQEKRKTNMQGKGTSQSQY